MQTRTSSVVVALLLLVASPPTAWASDSLFDRASLKSLNAIKVVVENVKPEAERDGLTRSQLLADVEMRLWESGIQVSGNAVPYLYVSVNALKWPNGGGYVFSIWVEFRQPVQIPRTGLPAIGATWSSTSSVGIVSLDNFSRHVQDSVRDKVDTFINAFLSVNPKP